MQRLVRSPFVAIVATLISASACNNSQDPSDSNSTVKSDWADEASPGGIRTYGIDWSCEPKQFGASAETKFAYQDEYCEWKTVKTTATEKQCRFTVSFDRSRDFYLNSRGKTPQNSIPAARQLVRDCNSIAEYRLDQGKTPGKLCSSITDNCVAGRNSDPEICDKTRWATGERYNGNIDFCIDQLAPNDFTSTPRPLMQFGVLTDIPENCEYADDEKTELLCTVAPDEDCFSVAGSIRVGMRVIVKMKPVAPANTEFESGEIFNEDTADGSGVEPAAEENLPSSKQCFVP